MSASLKLPNAFSQIGRMNASEWSRLAVQQAPQLVMGLAVLGIAWQAARLTWILLAPATAPDASQAAPAALPVATQSRNIDTQQIAGAHLFGIVNAGSTDPNNLPQSQAGLVLAGTMALDDPEAGFAIVGETAANAKFYRVGASLNGGARLHSVYTDRVIIDRNGTLETLILPHGLPSNAILPVARNTASNSNVGENLRRIVNENPGALGELLRAQPVFSNGVQKGYRVYPGRDRQQFMRLGLQPGDLVTTVNGSTLDDPARGAEILNTLTSSTTAQVTVERNGVSQVVALDMAQLSLPDTSGTTGNNASAESGASSSTTGVGSFVNPPGRAARAAARNRVPGGANNGADAQ